MYEGVWCITCQRVTPLASADSLVLKQFWPSIRLLGIVLIPFVRSSQPLSISSCTTHSETTGKFSSYWTRHRSDLEQGSGEKRRKGGREMVCEEKKGVCVHVRECERI